MFAADRSVEDLKERWAKPPSQFVLLDGMQIHLRDEGTRDDPVPIVLVHGTGASLHTWQGWVAELSPLHRRIVSFDRPGFGLTGPNSEGIYTMDYYAKFIVNLLDTLHINQCVLVGNSSGGRCAWQVAVTYPERVQKLVLVSAAGYPRQTPLPLGLRIAQSPILSPILEHILPRSAVENGLRNSYGNPNKVTQEAVDRNFELTLRAGNRKALGMTLRQAQGEDRAHLIREIKKPTLILVGLKDNVVPPNDADRFHSDIVGSKIVKFDDLGHILQEEDPMNTAKVFMEFLLQVENSN